MTRRAPTESFCSEIWPGNATDVKSLLPVAERLRQKFAVERPCLVADRGMIRKDTLKELEGRQWPYILGVRMRQDEKLKSELARSADYEEIYPKSLKKKDPSPLKVREATVNGRRCVICLNEDQATKDRHDREAILAALAALFPWELGQKADPFGSAPAGIKPEWYFLFMFQALKKLPAHLFQIDWLEGEVVGVLFFGFCGLVVLLVPFLDFGASRGRPRRLLNLLAALAVVFFIVMTVWGLCE